MPRRKKTELPVHNSAPDPMQIVVANASPLCDHRMFEGRAHLVGPAVILNEGVHNGSIGPLFYPAANIDKSTEAWNHKPVFVEHPEIGGSPASSCNTDVLENQKVGFLLNSQSQAGKLKTEIWVDVEKCNEVNATVLTNIQSGAVLEVSTGLFMDDTPVENGEAEWNGETYQSSVSNIRPDHLAILLSGPGACGVKDGAGFPRLNKEAKNELSSYDLRSRLRDLVRASLPDTDTVYYYCYVEDVYPESKTFIYQQESGGNSTLHRRSYTVTDDKVVLAGLPEAVIRKTVYEPVTNKSEAENPAAETPAPEESDGDQGLRNAEGKVKTTMEKIDKPETREEVLNLLSPADKALVTNALADTAALRAELVAALVANKCVLSQATLNSISLAELQALNVSLTPAPVVPEAPAAPAAPAPVANFAGQGTVQQPASPEAVIPVLNAFED